MDYNTRSKPGHSPTRQKRGKLLAAENRKKIRQIRSAYRPRIIIIIIIIKIDHDLQFFFLWICLTRRFVFTFFFLGIWFIHSITLTLGTYFFAVLCREELAPFSPCGAVVELAPSVRSRESSVAISSNGRPTR